MKVIILAGGKGTRLPFSADNLPKSLVKIDSKPLLQYQIDWLEKYGLNDIRLSLGYLAKPILDYLKGKYEYVIEPRPLGTGGAIKFASKDLKEEFLVLNGDILTDLNPLQFIDNFKKMPLQNAIVVCKYPEPKDFGLVEVKQNLVLRFLEKPSVEIKKQDSDQFISAGIYILSPDVFKKIHKEVFSVEKDVFPQLAPEKKLGVFLHEGFWIDIGTEERLKIVRKIYKNLS